MFKKTEKPAEQKADVDMSTEPLKFSERDKGAAREWFKKADQNRDKRDYDYAIEAYILGLAFWPEAVEEGHMPLRSLAVQRHQAGGKKPGMMETMKRSTTGKDFKAAMLNAEFLWAKDPMSSSYLDALIRNAAKAGFLDTLKWAAPLCLESLKKDAKPSKNRFKAFREHLMEGAETAASRGQSTLATELLEKAVDSLDFLVARFPTDDELRNERRNMSGRMAIERGKYEQAETFRDSLLDADAQKLLHDAERVKQGEQTLDSLIAAAKAEYEANPEVPGKINAYVDALLKPERKEEEDLAIQVLTEAFIRTKIYSFKLRADDIRLNQLRRDARGLRDRAKESGSEDDKRNARLANQDLLQNEIAIYRERVKHYPTDLRLKYKLGVSLFNAAEYDEAIPVLQAAQADPRTRTNCSLYVGRAFLEKGAAAQAINVLSEALDAYELTNDLSKELTFWLAAAYEAEGRKEDAKAMFGRLLRLEYNYRNGEARRRMEALG